MAAGEISPIVKAISRAEKHTSGEIRVHVSKRRWDRNPFASARRIFLKNQMTRTAERNGVLLYVNLRKKRFAIVADTGLHKLVGQSYWDSLAAMLQDDLRSTHWENAIALAVRTIGVTLATHFPAKATDTNPNELSNEVTTD